MAAPTPLTVAFYDPTTKGKDGEDRTLEDVLAFSDSELEYHHDFIQYLFPLPERSPINPYAPVINKATRDAFHERTELRASLFQALKRMMEFYGFDVTTTVVVGDEGKTEVFARPNQEKYDRNSRLWRTRFSHNHLRITRIIRCLRVLGLDKLAYGFHHILLSHDTNGKISDRTKMFWDRAATRGLHLAPEEESDDAPGVAWLRGGQAVEGAEAGQSLADGGFDASGGRMAVLATEEIGNERTPL